jgi:hypothetical protein
MKIRNKLLRNALSLVITIAIIVGLCSLVAYPMVLLGGLAVIAVVGMVSVIYAAVYQQLGQ